VRQLQNADMGLMVARFEIVAFHAVCVFRHVHRFMTGDRSVSSDDLEYALEWKLSFIPRRYRRQIGRFLE
jgi:hypothetical protein